MKELIKKIADIQLKLKAPKTQYNAFGKYNYRNCEDILEGVKPLLGELILTVSDDVVMVGDRIYIKATATITDGENSVYNSAFARESLSKKGQDDSQITGTASSYARKYALNGLLLIDDTKDADSHNNSQQQHKQAQAESQPKPDETALNWVSAIKNKVASLDQIDDVKYRAYIQSLLNFK